MIQSSPQILFCPKNDSLHKNFDPRKLCTGVNKTEIYNHCSTTKAQSKVDTNKGNYCMSKNYKA